MFQQAPPTLANQYEDDRMLRSYLSRVCPTDVLREIEPSLIEMGRLAASELYQMQLDDRLNEPTLTQWDAWGNRIDKIEVTRRGRVRRAKLYYLRGRTGRAARIKERRT